MRGPSDLRGAPSEDSGVGKMGSAGAEGQSSTHESAGVRGRYAGAWR